MTDQQPDYSYDPNSGAYPQPGGFALGGAAVEPQPDEAAAAETRVEPESEANWFATNQQAPQAEGEGPKPEDAEDSTETATKEQEVQNQATPSDEKGSADNEYHRPRKRAAKKAAAAPDEAS